MATELRQALGLLLAPPAACEGIIDQAQALHRPMGPMEAIEPGLKKGDSGEWEKGGC